MFEKLNIYFVMMFVLAFVAVEKAISPFEWYDSYLAILQWLLLFGLGKFFIDKREEVKE